MILAFDTYYYDNKAKTVCITFSDWTADSDFEVFSEITEGIEAYESGAFYKRELPCILSLLKTITVKNIEAIIIDGFVFLDDNQQPGLGAHLYKQLENKIPVIGVAKTNYATLEKNKRELIRGKSIRPLYITAIGMPPDKATELIKNMSGPNRIPTLLKTLDTLTKE